MRDKEIDKSICLVYTPLNGTGNYFVRRVLKDRGFKNVFVVKEQEHPDPDFKSVANPNPEYEVAFELAKRLGAEKMQNFYWLRILIVTEFRWKF